MNQQQSSNTTKKDIILQLLQSGVLKQRNLNDKISHEEISRLIDDIISSSEDDTVKLRRSKRDLPSLLLPVFMLGVRTVALGSRGLALGASNFASIMYRVLSTQRGREIVKDLIDKALEGKDIMDTIEDLRRTGLFKTNEEQFTEVPHTTERRQVTTETPQTTEASQITTEVLKTTEDYSHTTLHRAAEQGNLNAVKYFVEKGTDINSRNEDKNTPLHLAAQNGYLDIVKYLIDKGADISIKNLYNTTPLHLSAQNGHLDIVKHFIDKGADFTSFDSYGKTSLFYAAESGNLDLVKYLIEKGASINVEGRRNDISVLPHAAESGNLDLVKYLVEKGAHINVDYWIGTPLHTAVSKGNLEVVKYLVDAGANVNMKDGNKNTPLHLAAKNGNLDIVKYLIENGADPKAIDSDGKTPLDWAAQDCRLDIVEHLTEQATIEGQQITEGYSNTFSYLASEQGNLNKEGFFVEKGKDKKGEIPLDEGSGSGHVDIVGYSKEEGQQVTERSRVTCEPDNTSLHLAAKHGELDRVKCLVEKGADINAKDESGLTPLHQAVIYRAIYGSLDVVKYLVENGADINARSETGPRLFLEDGFGIGSKSKTGRTPLHYAAIHGLTSFAVVNGRITGGCLHGNLDVVKYLVKKGADLTARDEDGKTPLDLAKSRCNPQVAEFLSSRCSGRSRRDLASNSLMNNSIVNWVKGLISSTESPGLLTSEGHNNHAVTASPEINTTVVNNTIMLGILATGLFNKTQHRQPIHENLLSPREQSMRLNNIDENMIIRAIQQGEEKFGDPDTKMDEVKISGNKTGMWK